MQNFMSPGLARKANITLIDIPNEYGVTMIDGTRVQTKVKQEIKNIDLKIGTHEEMIHFDIMPLDPHELVLSILWLRKHNPEVNWVKGIFSFPKCLDNLDCSDESYELDDSEEEFYDSRD